MAYKNIEALVEEVEKFHPVYLWDDLSNYLTIKERIQVEIDTGNVEHALEEMWRLTGIYETLTRVRYSRNNKFVDMERIKKDFLVATTEIEYEYCNHGLTGDFEITKETIETNWRLVDWEAYYNKNRKNFMEACKKADKLYNVDIEDIIEYYADDSRFNFIEVYPTLYNERVIGVFDNEDDAYYWSNWYDEIEEIDGLFYVDHAGY